MINICARSVTGLGMDHVLEPIDNTGIPDGNSWLLVQGFGELSDFIRSLRSDLLPPRISIIGNQIS